MKAVLRLLRIIPRALVRGIVCVHAGGSMTPSELAARLNGREYGSEITKDEEAEAKAAGLVVLFGYSDDNMEFRGAVDEEIGCWDGGFVMLTRAGLLQNECDNENCPHFEKLSAHAVKIEALWCEEPGYSWTYRTAIPHATFEIVEDGEPYGRGIVFALADVPEVA